MHTIKQLFNTFHLCSGLWIDFSKTEILPATHLPVLSMVFGFPFPVAEGYITYLGIKIGRPPSSLHNLNYPPLITKILSELEAWMDLPSSLFGRCHLFRMVSFAQLLYPLQTIPLLLKHKDIYKLYKMVSLFFGKTKDLVLCWNYMSPEVKGAENLSNIWVYSITWLAFNTLV